MNKNFTFIYLILTAFLCGFLTNSIVRRLEIFFETGTVPSDLRFPVFLLFLNILMFVLNLVNYKDCKKVDKIHENVP